MNPRSSSLSAHSPRLRAGAALALLSLLAACATAPRNDAASGFADLPANWTAGQAAAPPSSLAAWWQGFDDPALAKLIEQALGANTDVQGALAALRQARAQRDVQAASLAPTLGVSGSAQRSRSGGQTRNQFQAGFDAGWEPDVFGANRSAVSAADADASASAASLGAVRISVAAEAASHFIALRGAQVRLGIARDNLASQFETLQIARWRNQAGLATSLEVEQARAAAEQTRATLPALQTTIDQALNALAVLTGQAPGALAGTLDGAGAIPLPGADLALAFPADTLRQRPDVRAAEWQVSAAAARLAQADAARYPSFSLGGSLGLSALTLGSLTSSGAVVGALLGSVSMPLLDGGAAKARVAVQDAAIDAARIGYRAVVLAALQDVEDALVALRGHRERLATLQTAAEAAANAALLARQRYSSGLVDFQTVLETQRTLLAAQDGVASTTADLGSDHVRLYKALGGGWPGGDEPSSTESGS